MEAQGPSYTTSSSGEGPTSQNPPHKRWSWLLWLILGVAAVVYPFIDAFLTHFILYALLAILAPAYAWVAPTVLGVIGLIGLVLIGVAAYQFGLLPTEFFKKEKWLLNISLDTSTSPTPSGSVLVVSMTPVEEKRITGEQKVLLTSFEQRFKKAVAELTWADLGVTAETIADVKEKDKTFKLKISVTEDKPPQLKIGENVYRNLAELYTLYEADKTKTPYNEHYHELSSRYIDSIKKDYIHRFPIIDNLADFFYGLQPSYYKHCNDRVFSKYDERCSGRVQEVLDPVINELREAVKDWGDSSDLQPSS